MSDTELSTLEQRIRNDLTREAESVTASVDPPPTLVAAVVRRRRARAASAVFASCILLAGAAVAVPALTPESTTSNVAVGPSSPGDRGDLQLPAPGELDFDVRAMATSPLAPREDAAGVWTGSEFVVWGGAGSEANDRVFDDGASYSVRADAWGSLAAAPLSPRSRHTAVWSGEEMIVWGGTSTRFGVGGLLDGAAYDPRTDSWRPIRSAPPGTERSFAQAIVVDGTMIVAGGATSTGPAATSALLYDIAGDVWTERELHDAIYAIAPMGTGAAVAGVDSDSGTFRIKRVEANTGDVQDFAGFSTAGHVEWLGLAWTGTNLVAAATGDGETTVGILDPSDGSWKAVTTVPSDHFTPALGVSFPFAPTINAWTGRWLVSWPPSGLNAVAPGTEETVTLHDDRLPCAANGVAVWTGSQILQWGGQECQGESAGGQRANGVVLTFRSS